MTALAPLSQDKLHEIAHIAYRNGVYPYDGEPTSDFVMRLLRTLDRYPVMQHEIHVIVHQAKPSFPTHYQSPTQNISAGNAAVWALRVGLVALGVYGFF